MVLQDQIFEQDLGPGDVAFVVEPAPSFELALERVVGATLVFVER